MKALDPKALDNCEITASCRSYAGCLMTSIGGLRGLYGSLTSIKTAPVASLFYVGAAPLLPVSPFLPKDARYYHESAYPMQPHSHSVLHSAWELLSCGLEYDSHSKLRERPTLSRKVAKSYPSHIPSLTSPEFS